VAIRIWPPPTVLVIDSDRLRRIVCVELQDDPDLFPASGTNVYVDRPFCNGTATVHPDAMT